MFNWVYKLGGFYFTKPSVSYLPAKSVNVFFKNAINPKFLLLNLNDVSSIGFSIEVDQGDVDNTYILVVEKNLTEKIELAEFNSREKAENAMELLRIKIFGIEKSIIKTGLMLVFIVLILGLISDIILVQYSKAAIHREIADRAKILPAPNGTLVPQQGLSPEEISRLLGEANRNAITQQQNQGGQATPDLAPPVDATPPSQGANEQPQEPLSPGDEFLRQLQR